MAETKRHSPHAVRENIHCVADLERAFEERRTAIDRVADTIGSFTGSFGFVFVHALWFIAWFLINTGCIPGVRKFDPYPFILLAMIVSVEGVLLSTFVLMKQNRMQQRTDARDHLNLQIDLLSEKEVTKALQLLRAVCRKLEVTDQELNGELDEMAGNTSVDSLAQEIQSEMKPRKTAM